MTLQPLDNTGLTGAGQQQADAGEPLENLVARIEIELAALGGALGQQDSAAIEHHADALHLALVAAMQASVSAAQDGKLPRALRTRLMHATGQLAVQWESLARATVALDRAMDILMPHPRADVYSARSLQSLPRGGGSLFA